MQITNILYTCLAAQTAVAASLPLRLLSFNIRYAATTLEKGEQPWSVRAQPLINAVKGIISGAPSGAQSVLGFQEVLYSQLQDIADGLGSNYAYIGVGRDDGKQAGEFNPIFYRRTEVRLIYNTTKWLSPTPDVPSYGWGAGSRRIVNVGVFQNLATGKRFIHANTHLDQKSLEARQKGIQVAVSVIQAVQKTYGPLAVSLTGDFNSESVSGDAYAILTAGGYLADVYATATPSQRFGYYNTSTGFDPAALDKNSKRIDYIFLGPVADKRWKVDRYTVQTNVINNLYISDHRPVIADVEIVV